MNHKAPLSWILKINFAIFFVCIDRKLTWIHRILLNWIFLFESDLLWKPQKSDWSGPFRNDVMLFFDVDNFYKKFVYILFQFYFRIFISQSFWCHFKLALPSFSSLEISAVLNFRVKINLISLKSINKSHETQFHPATRIPEKI